MKTVVCMHACTHACMLAYLHVCVCVCVCVCVTHTHGREGKQQAFRRACGQQTPVRGGMV